jgi:hypothetical protein
MVKSKVIAILCLLLLSACSAELDDYDDSEPAFDLFDYFQGPVSAWGMVQDYSGRQTRRFSVDLLGTVKDDTLTLEEQFWFADGEQDTRVWVITRHGDGQYTGQADDIIGEAVGRELGNALRWQYNFALQADGEIYEVSFDDWLYRQDENRVFNLTKIKKFGIEVGAITLFFSKQ